MRHGSDRSAGRRTQPDARACEGGRLTLAYEPDRISLRFEGSTLQGTSYIAYDRDGLKVRAKNHGPMDAAAAAKYIVARLMKVKMP
jgi:hypothetical protein